MESHGEQSLNIPSRRGTSKAWNYLLENLKQSFVSKSLSSAWNYLGPMLRGTAFGYKELQMHLLSMDLEISEPFYECEHGVWRGPQQQSGIHIQTI